MEQVSVETFRAGMGNILDRVYYRNEHFVITRNGIPFVTLHPVPTKANIKHLTQGTAKNLRIKTSEMLGAVHFGSGDLLIVRRGKPTALVSSLRSADPG